MDYALLNDLNSQINALRAENDELSKRPVSCPECEEVAPTIINNYSENVVYFRLNSAKIDKNQQINIFNTAEFMKEKGTPIKVIGYADKDTGTSEYNMGLSERRAKAVAKELIDKYGISSNQITIEWRGSDEQPYDKNNWNRVVIMRANN
jgi:outer membrane protein OmpA-like peptidoglycan-associated protein